METTLIETVGKFKFATTFALQNRFDALYSIFNLECPRVPVKRIVCDILKLNVTKTFGIL